MPRHDIDPDAALDDWRTGTAERPRVAVPADQAPPPTPVDVPGPARYPLYADDPAPAPAPAPAPVWDTDPPTTALPPAGERRLPGWLPWVAATAVVLVVVAYAGARLLLGGGDSSPAAADRSTPVGQPTPSPQASHPPSHQPSPSATPTPTRHAGVQDVAAFATVSAPRTAPPSVDAQGNRVTYRASNLVDGHADTCWRMTGDGSGTTLTVRLDQPTRLRRVGLVNGYAKLAYDARHRLDWYHGNRRVTAVRWTFDDGSSVTQRFGDDRRMQTQRIAAVTTRTVRITILSVTRPGHGPAGRDDTAISELSLVGSVAG